MSASRLLKNPISFCIYGLTALFVVLSFGEPPLLVVQHIVAPYTVDITRGVGQELASAFRGLVIILQIVLLSLVYAVASSQARGQRTMLAILGCIVALTYFLFIALGYVAPRLH